MYGRISDKIELTLPSSAKLTDGRWVSNYNRLPYEASLGKPSLKSEGWKPKKEIRPSYDEKTQYLKPESALDDGTNIVITYTRDTTT